MRLLPIVACVVAGIAVLFAGTQPAAAAKKTYEDKKLGYRIKLEDSYTQNPPKLTGDEAYIVGDWYEDAAKFDSPFLRPTLQIFWFVEPKETVVKTDPTLKISDIADDDALRRAAQEMFRCKSADEHIDRILSVNEHLFGPASPMSEHWSRAEKDKTAKGVPFEYVEINSPTKKKKKDDAEYRGYCFMARLELDRPKEKIHVGFWGSTSTQFTKRFMKEFPQIVRSFEDTRTGTDSRNTAAGDELSKDPVKRREQIRKTKLVQGWKAMDTKNYILVYHEEVQPKLVQQIGDQIEAIRSQVYEVLFPADRPVTDVSIVRVCKDPAQYMGYGAPQGSAGYWDHYSEELVFYEDQSNKKDSLRVLYHEAFHQYIFYSVGNVSPHSWFNEGHGDYFAGHDYSAGRFQRNVFQWRVSTAKEWKRNPKRPPLKEWIHWTQGQYYGNNKEGVDGLANYALGWSLVYFLRTTKKPEYEKVLDRYFNSLKGSVTRQREADEAWKKKLEDWEKKLKDDPTLPMPERDSTSDTGSRKDTYAKAIDDAFMEVDWDKLEKDWLASDY